MTFKYHAAGIESMMERKYLGKNKAGLQLWYYINQNNGEICFEATPESDERLARHPMTDYTPTDHELFLIFDAIFNETSEFLAAYLSSGRKYR